MRRKRTKTRRGTDDLFRRVCELVLLTHAGEYPSRSGLAQRWKMTPRAVSYVIDHAERMYGVRVRHVAEGIQAGYALDCPGVLNVSALEGFKP